MLDEKYRIILVGLNRFQRMFLKLGGYSRITAIGRLQNVEELCRLYNGASVYVNTTLEDNFPTTNLEALSCGTPVITFRTGGSPESVDEECGLVVEKGNEVELKKAVEEICRNPKKYSVQKILKKAQRFREEKMIKEYMELYAEVFEVR